MIEHKEATSTPDVVVQSWRVLTMPQLIQLGKHCERLRFSFGFRYSDTMAYFIKKGLCTDERDYESCMQEIEAAEQALRQI